MRLVILFVFLSLTGCAANRVLVKDCQKLEGIEQWNCEVIQKL